jgi:iron complex outermembrane recepter protein
VEDKKTADFLGADDFGDTLVFNPGTSSLAKIDWKDYSLRAGLNYQVTENELLYASYNRGIKGPNFSAPTFFPFPVQDIAHRAETLHALELGVKSTFADNHARLNVDVFGYDYKDYQAFLFVDVVNRILNRDAYAYGLEAEFTVLPLEGLTFSGGLSLMNSEVKNVPYPSGVGTENPKLPQAPAASFNLIARYERPVFDGLKGALQVDATFTGGTYFTVLAAPVDYEPAHTVANARLSLGAVDNRWEVAAFVRNLNNEAYRVYSADVSSLGYRDSIYAQLRSYGAEIRFNF